MSSSSNQLVMFTGDQLPATLDEISKEDRREAAEMIGQAGDRMGNGLPKLRVNYDAEFVPENDPEAEPITLKRGYFKISVLQEDSWVTVYCKNPVIRIYWTYYRYSAYDQANNTSLVTSSLFQKWKELVIDDGGHEFSSGVYKKRMLEACPELDGKLKCQHLIFGTVTFPDGKDMHGNSVDVVDVPFQWYVKGASYMPFEELKEQIEAEERLYPYCSIKLSTTRKTNGSVNYFVINFALDKKAATDPNNEVNQMFAETANAENEQIIEAFDKAIRKRPPAAAAVVQEYIDGQAPLDDEIPF